MSSPTVATTLAYRCPHCGQTVVSMEGIFALSGDLLKLKCDCGQSELTLTYQKDGRVHLDVPCLFCPRPHSYTVSATLLKGRKLFDLACPYSGLQTLLCGTKDAVLAAAREADAALAALMQEAGVTDFSALHQAEEEDARDPQVDSIVSLTVENLCAEGRIDCNCADRAEQQIQFEFLADSLLVYCKHCGATRMYGVSNLTTAMAFMDTDRIDLKDR